jgi:hypothetical protein
LVVSRASVSISAWTAAAADICCRSRYVPAWMPPAWLFALYAETKALPDFTTPASLSRVPIAAPVAPSGIVTVVSPVPGPA